MMPVAVAIPGQAKTVVVLDSGGPPIGAVCTIMARSRREKAQRRLLVTGLVTIDASAIDHLERHVVPIVDGIAGTLLPHYQPPAIELSAVNLGAASSRDIAVHVAGFSLDVAVFLAVLSAVLKIRVRQDVAATGHLASAAGEVRSVRALDAKLAAAAADPAIRMFLIPALDADTSVQTLTPSERELTQAAIAEAKRHLRVVQVADIRDLIGEAFDDEAIVAGSLRSDFFEPTSYVAEGSSPGDRVIHLLAEANDERFWSVMERHLMAGNGDSARRLLRLRAGYQIRRRRYPHGFGLRLGRLVASVPITTRRSKGLLPLLPKDVGLELARLARGDDFDDVQFLFQVVAGRSPVGPRSAPAATIDTESAAQAGVDAVLAEISESALAERIGKGVDLARATFVLPEVTVATYEEFLDAVAVFYSALLRHAGSPLAAADDEIVRADSLALLERTFAEQGGLPAAWAEGRDGIHGGLRLVLDLMTERLRRELYARQVHSVLTAAIDPLDFKGRVEFMSALLQRLGPHLPADVRAQPARRYARHYAMIVEAYVRSLDRVNQLLRTM